MRYERNQFNSISDSKKRLKLRFQNQRMMSLLQTVTSSCKPCKQFMVYMDIDAFLHANSKTKDKKAVHITFNTFHCQVPVSAQCQFQFHSLEKFNEAEFSPSMYGIKPHRSRLSSSVNVHLLLRCTSLQCIQLLEEVQGAVCLACILCCSLICLHAVL